MQQIEGTFYEDCTKTLHELSEKEFLGLQMEFQERYASRALEYRIPKLRFVSVPLDSRLMKIEQSIVRKLLITAGMYESKIAENQVEKWRLL